MERRRIATNGITLDVTLDGPEDGPAVLLLHGFPESAVSWRAQIHALSGAGYRVIAPDQRGYGHSDAPEAIDAYTVLHMTGDAIGLLDALKVKQAVVAGHDWGAPVAFHLGLLRPDRISAVMSLSVPYAPRGPIALTALMRQNGVHNFYMLYFQEPGVAEAEFEANVAKTMRAFLYTGSGDNTHPRDFGIVPPEGMMSTLVDPDTLPPWLEPDALADMVARFEHGGFRGPLNWYRNVDRTWELTAALHEKPLEQPYLFIAGSKDGVIKFPGARTTVEALREVAPNVRGAHLLEGAGHWVQQERPEEVSRLMLSFLKDL